MHHGNNMAFQGKGPRALPAAEGQGWTIMELSIGAGASDNVTP